MTPFTKVLIAGSAILATSCEANDPVEATITNGFAPGPRAPTLEKVWYRSTLWRGPIAPQATSESRRVGTGAERAYAIMTLDAQRFVIVSRAVITAAPGTSLSIEFSGESSAGQCLTATKLPAADYDFVTSRIFPGERAEPFGSPRCRHAASEVNP